MKKKNITPALTSFSCRWRWQLQLQLQPLSTSSSSLTLSSLAVTAAGTTVAAVLVGVGMGCRCSCSSCRPPLALLQLLSLLAAGSSQMGVAFVLDCPRVGPGQGWLIFTDPDPDPLGPGRARVGSGSTLGPAIFR